MKSCVLPIMEINLNIIWKILHWQTGILSPFFLSSPSPAQQCLYCNWPISSAILCTGVRSAVSSWWVLKHMVASIIYDEGLSVSYSSGWDYQYFLRVMFIVNQQHHHHLQFIQKEVSFQNNSHKSFNNRWADSCTFVFFYLLWLLYAAPGMGVRLSA